MPVDVFPQTLTAWIRDRLIAGGRREVNRHVMDVYALPLRVYYLGTRDQSLGEPDEVIQGFFADRLGRAEFFAQWQSSNLPLRRWLINGFNFYLKELRRANRRNRATGEESDELPTFEGEPGAAMELAFLVSIVRTSLHHVQRECDSTGLQKHWTSFFEHFCLERPYADIARDLEVDPARAMVMARTVRHKFQAEVRRSMSIDGADQHLDQAILDLVQGSPP
jgi:hypothetical protein